MTQVQNYETIRRARNAYVVCDPCGRQHGRGFYSNGAHRAKSSLSTFHQGRCDICRRKKVVTEFRDYGYAKYESSSID